MSHLTIHIALDDQSPENGCLHYVPGMRREEEGGGERGRERREDREERMRKE